jgi:hypothetical protein
MNTDVLHQLIDRYEEKIEKLYGAENYELFKWQATKTWQTEWAKPNDAFLSFADRFAAARKDFDVFIDGKIMHPSTGVIKLWEKAPDEIEHLFNEVLFADDFGDVVQTQNNMDKFLEEYEKVRERFFPKFFSYKQDRHSASVFLAVNAPEQNFVFKSSDAHMMARYTEFGFSIGSGGSFSLQNYYRLCEDIIAALREHDSLLEKHFSYLENERLYRDESLHLLAFDLMYCCRTYNYYKGIVLPPKKKKASNGGTAPKHEPTAEELEAERQEKIALLNGQISETDAEIEEIEAQCEELFIPLMNVEVTSPKYGTGTVIEQNDNRIKVRYPEQEIAMIMGNVPKNPLRPAFENNEAVWASYSEYAKAKDRIKTLEEKMATLQTELAKLESSD